MSKARARTKVEVRLSEERKLELIRRPIITEKTTMMGEHNQVAFEVPLDASKPEIKAAIEGVFSVKVKAVNTLISKGKTKRFRGRPGKRSDIKKAMVTLEEGHSIDVTTGI